MLTKKKPVKNEEKSKSLKNSISSTSLVKNSNRSLTKPSSSVNSQKTKIIVKCDIGFSNSLTIRGEGAGLNWEKGQILKNIKNDEWTWETNHSFQSCQFKVLINDQHYELGENHSLKSGSTIQYVPRF